MTNIYDLSIVKIDLFHTFQDLDKFLLLGVGSDMLTVTPWNIALALALSDQ